MPDPSGSIGMGPEIVPAPPELLRALSRLSELTRVISDADQALAVTAAEDPLRGFELDEREKSFGRRRAVDEAVWDERTALASDGCAER